MGHVRNRKKPIIQSLEQKYIYGRIRSGSKENDIKVAADFAKVWLNVKKENGVTGCAVFDIDDTLCTDKNDPIKPVIDALYHCNKLKIPVYLLTARPNDPYNRKLTVEWLDNNNIIAKTNYKKLIMMPVILRNQLDLSGDFKKITSTFKADERRKIGHIIANFGDQPSDEIISPYTKNLSFMNNIVKETAIISPIVKDKTQYESDMFFKFPGR